MDECLSAANSTTQGKAGSPLQHRSCLKVGPLAPPPSTASHLWERHAPMKKLACLHSGSPEPREHSLNKCQRWKQAAANREASSCSLMLFLRSYVKCKEQRERKQGIEVKVIGRAVVSLSLYVSLRTGCQISGARPMADKTSPCGKMKGSCSRRALR